MYLIRLSLTNYLTKLVLEYGGVGQLDISNFLIETTYEHGYRLTLRITAQPVMSTGRKYPILVPGVGRKTRNKAYGSPCLHNRAKAVAPPQPSARLLEILGPASTCLKFGF